MAALEFRELIAVR